MLDGTLATFECLEHPFLKGGELGRRFVERGPGALLGCVHEPLSLVFRFECHGFKRVFYQKLHIRNGDVLKSTETKPSGVSGVKDC